MDQTMEGKIAVVTGASRGIGKAIAVKLASKGATVVINYNGSRERAEEVKNEEPQSISLLSTFEPLTSVVLGTIVLHETITRQSGWGIVCILLAVCLVSTTKDP